MNLFELFVKIGVDDQASGKLKDIGGKLGNGLKTSAKIGMAAVGAAAAGITALTTAAVNNYAEYEQLVGGAELMFGEAFETVMKNSKNAYKTVQMSQNEYLQQVNGFATGLKTALGGNEQAAADLAHKIVQAEADIVAATGNTQENVANAFNGIMKSNFTMLDNLQIGITPTKEGFQEVIDKVNAWNAEMGNATNYQMGNLADMQSALVDYIDMVGMSGYAQAEAAGTISGSLAAMKGAWQNLLTGLADGNADIGELVNNLVTTIVGDGTEENLGVFGNILPAVQAALTGASTLVRELIPQIVQIIPAVITENLPILAEAAISIIQSLVDGISKNQKELMKTAFEVITFWAKSLIEMLPQIVELGLELIVSLANGIADSLPELIPTIIDVILQIVDTLTDPTNLKTLLQAALEIIMELDIGLINSIPQLVGACFDIVNGIIAFLIDPTNLSMLVAAALELVIALAGGLISAIPEMMRGSAELIASLITSFKEKDWGQVGKDIISGIRKGIENAWKNLKEWFSGLFTDLIGIAKRILGIKSPSRVFRDQIGKQMAAGLMVGWDDEFGSVKKKIEKSLNFKATKIGVTASVGSYGSGNGGSPYGYGVSVVQNIYSEAKTAADLMEEAIYLQKRAVMLGV